MHFTANACKRVYVIDIRSVYTLPVIYDYIIFAFKNKRGDQLKESHPKDFERSKS